MGIARPRRKRVRDARNQLRALLAEAAKGWPTTITRHGRAIVAAVPVDTIKPRPHQMPLTPLARSGKGLWGRDSATTTRRPRGEWGRWT